MIKEIKKIALVLIVLALAQVLPPPVHVQAAGPNDYFNMLLARPDIWKSFSFRNQDLIDSKSPGASYNRLNPYVLYDPIEDAAKVTIEAFPAAYTLLSNVSATDDIISIDSGTDSGALLICNRGLKIDNEIMTVYCPDGKFGSEYVKDSTGAKVPNLIRVQRGTNGTAAASHTAGPLMNVGRSSNSLLAQVRPDLGTADGNTYFIVWDAMFTSSWLDGGGTGGKTFQLADTQKSTIWLETNVNTGGQTGFGSNSGAVIAPGFDPSKMAAAISVRSYNNNLVGAAGSNVLGTEPLRPQLANFNIYPNRWTRFFWKIDQRANGFDPVSLWMADEVTGPVQLFDNLTVDMRGTPPTIAQWYVEFNSSFDLIRPHFERPVVSYVRNFAVLQNPGDITSLLQKPIAPSISGNIPPTVAISAPFNGDTFKTAPAKFAINAIPSDADGSITKVEFYNGSTKLAEDASAPYTFTWDNVAAGNYTITAKAYDNAGAVAVSPPVNIGVTTTNTPPTVSLTSPSNNSTFAAPATINLAANASDTNGSISKVEFYNGSTLLNSDSASPYSFSWSNVPAGSYTLKAKAYDNAGASTTSSSVAVTVTGTAVLSGDLNNDCIVNSLDWSVMNSKWFTSDTTADLNHDGIVNTLDWSIMNSNWFKTC